MIFLSARVFPLGILSLLLGGLIGCKQLMDVSSTSLATESLTKIEQLKEQQNRNSPVYLKGRIAKQAPFLDSGAYQLQDATGSIWVLTNKNFPDLGKEIVVQAKVHYQSIPIGDRDLGELYLVELEQTDCQKNSIPRNIKQLCQQK